MRRFRCLPFVAGSALGAWMGLVACSGGNPRPDADPDSTDAMADSVAHLPEASRPAPDATDDAFVPYDGSAEPVVCTEQPCAVELVAGSHHFCARLADGTVQCWGDDARGKLGGGPGDDAGALGPVKVVGLEGITQLSAAGETTCARSFTGEVRCWGSNASGLLGLQASPALVDSDSHSTPATVALTRAASRVDVGLASACALVDGELWCWGSNGTQQLARSGSDAVGGPAPRTWARIAFSGPARRRRRAMASPPKACCSIGGPSKAVRRRSRWTASPRVCPRFRP
ncbi:RCC1 domain-containing protein [Labilithrix luteola]|uniref:RCC1 domain-containing protein n=1 Tax=Labilithrix luteola TaxID=1391654 RepID=UPI0014737133|nr:hypothetical protein [Labilithrix luteola]